MAWHGCNGAFTVAHLDGLALLTLLDRDVVLQEVVVASLKNIMIAQKRKIRPASFASIGTALRTVSATYLEPTYQSWIIRVVQE